MPFTHFCRECADLDADKRADQHAHGQSIEHISVDGVLSDGGQAAVKMIWRMSVPTVVAVDTPKVYTNMGR